MKGQKGGRVGMPLEYFGRFIVEMTTRRRCIA